jgi:dihydrolipoamide dehydrogenase
VGTNEKKIIVIGGGIGGYPAALRAARLGAQVVLIERDKLGGVCLNWGCVPTKTLLQSAEIYSTMKRAPSFGVKAESISIDFAAMMRRKEGVVRQLTSGVEKLLKDKKVEIIRGTATFSDQKTIKIMETGKIIQGDKVIIATGSVPTKPDIPGIDGPNIMTSDDILSTKSLPKGVLIIGGGYIGVELGQLLSRLGVRVTIVEILSHTVPREDEDVGEALKKRLQEEGIDIYTNSTVEKIEPGKKIATVTYATPEGKKTVRVEKVILASGRRPYAEGLGLEKIGVRVDKDGIIVNNRMETNIPGIYAIGDSIGGIMLAHMAMAEGEYAARNAMGISSEIDYAAVPRCIYSFPEIGAVGMTEGEARERYNVKVSRFPLHANSKANILGETHGMVKIIAEEEEGDILGVHIYSPHATDLISEAVFAMEMEATAEELAHVIHPHPTLSEALGEAAQILSGGAIHLP